MTLRNRMHALAGALMLVPLAVPATPAVALQLGGFRAVSVDDETVQAAANFAAEQMGGELSSIDAAAAQTVAGVNYRLEITLADETRWRVTVNRSVEGEFSVVGQPTEL